MQMRTYGFVFSRPLQILKLWHRWIFEKHFTVLLHVWLFVCDRQTEFKTTDETECWKCTSVLNDLFLSASQMNVQNNVSGLYVRWSNQRSLQENTRRSYRESEGILYPFLVTVYTVNKHQCPTDDVLDDFDRAKFSFWCHQVNVTARGITELLMKEALIQSGLTYPIPADAVSDMGLSSSNPSEYRKYR